MKQAWIESYGPPETIKLIDRDIPKPGSNEILVKIETAAINPLDIKIRNGSLKFLTLAKPPRGLGSDFSGKVVSVGSYIRGFSKDDEVFGAINQFVSSAGSYSEYILVSASQITKKPTDLSHEDAASIPIAGLTALQGLKNFGKIKAGATIFINGASGGVGSFAVQLAKIYGAKIIATCSKGKKAFVEGLGADQVLDYTDVSLTKFKGQFDIIFDVSAHLNFWVCKKYLTPNGIFITTLPQPFNLIGTAASLLMSKKSKFINVNVNPTDLDYMSHLFISGELKSVVKKTVDLEDIVQAHKDYEEGSTYGKTVIKIH